MDYTWLFATGKKLFPKLFFADTGDFTVMKKINDEIMDKLISSSYFTENENNQDMVHKIEKALSSLEAFEKADVTVEYTGEEKPSSLRGDVEKPSLTIEEATSMTDNVCGNFFVLKEER